MPASLVSDTHLGVEAGVLVVEGVSCVELARRFGTPLYVLSERGVRDNYRRFLEAFREAYDGSVEVLYSNKANPSPAVARILAQEGAGAECYTEGELYLALLGGCNPGDVLLHDANRPRAYLDAGVHAGVTFAVDGLDELEELETLGRMRGTTIRILLRLRLGLHALDALPNQWSPDERIGEVVRAYKLGAPEPEAVALLERALASEWLEPAGVHFHLGRWGDGPTYYTTMIAEMLEITGRIARACDWRPRIVNIGGGFVHGRPEGNGPHNGDTDVAPIEDYATAICRDLQGALDNESLGRPTLQLEPGRYLVDNAGIVLTTVGKIRAHDERTWIFVDARGDDLPAVDSAQNWYYHSVAATRMDDDVIETVDIVGRGCNFELLGASRPMPALQPGDLVAFLDTGGYTDAKAGNMNAAPRAASVLVRGDDAAIISRRERLEDVVARYSIPSWLFSGP